MNFRFTNTAEQGRVVPREEEAQALRNAGMTERQVKAYLANRNGDMSDDVIGVSPVHVIPSKRPPATAEAITTITSGSVAPEPMEQEGAE